jgi:hypothetical protein
MLGACVFVKIFPEVDHLLIDTHLMYNSYAKPFAIGITAYEVPAGMDAVYLRELLCWPIENIRARDYDITWRRLNQEYPVIRYRPPTEYLQT